MDTWDPHPLLDLGPSVVLFLGAGANGSLVSMCGSLKKDTEKSQLEGEGCLTFMPLRHRKRVLSLSIRCLCGLVAE